MNQIIKQINLLCDEQIKSEIQNFLETHIKLEEKVSILANSFCYDRELCKELKLDYNKMPNNHFNRLYLASWYILTKKENGNEM